jgi:hypothetical protein
MWVTASEVIRTVVWIARPEIMQGLHDFVYIAALQGLEQPLPRPPGERRAACGQAGAERTGVREGRSGGRAANLPRA